MNDVLLFTFNELKASNGISKKIEYQKSALEKNGCKVHLMYIKREGNQILLYINEKLIASYCYNVFWLLKMLSFQCILSYIKENRIGYIYVRYIQFASFSINRLFKKFRCRNIKILLEIPTYPYDSEFKGFKMGLLLIWEKMWRKVLAKYLDYIVTYTQLDTIWGKPTIKIKNGVDFSKIKVREKNSPITNNVELIAVAGISFWHGFDRIIEGLYLYYQNRKDTINVHLNIVGKGDINVYNSLVNLVDKYKLTKHVDFCGNQFGEALDVLFETADIAIGCLGCHRKNVKEVSSLKNVEYAARGIPFIYSEINRDFDNMVYIKKEPADDSPINIEELINWRKELSIQPRDICNTVKNILSWEEQMRIVQNAFVTC